MFGVVVIHFSLAIGKVYLGVRDESTEEIERGSNGGKREGGRDNGEGKGKRQKEKEEEGRGEKGEIKTEEKS